MTARFTIQKDPPRLLAPRVYELSHSTRSEWHVWIPREQHREKCSDCPDIANIGPGSQTNGAAVYKSVERLQE